MDVKVDRVGRVLIPKALRTMLGIGPDTVLDIIPDGAGLRLDPVRPSERRVEERDGLPILGAVPGAVLTDTDVQRLRDDAAR